MIPNLFSTWRINNVKEKGCVEFNWMLDVPKTVWDDILGNIKSDL